MRAMMFIERALKEIVVFVILAVIIVLPIRLFVAQPFVVDGESMHPTFENAQYLIVDELSYHFESPSAATSSCSAIRATRPSSI